ncbi:MAG TPA: 8-amino-7-oxononanoate synthase [Gammaproteobacteria bacterium]|mgnify:CR=1 FL=1|nr:8-amino-7-oxononanoate synthase [Gammaproteobacteria bacterium]
MRDLSLQLQDKKQANQYRTRRIQDGMQGAHVVLDGKKCLAFCSNDYLGLSHHPDVIKAMQQGAAKYGAGSGAAHLINGHSRAHHALEEELADFVERPRALLFSTGYMANLGVISTLLQRGDTVIEDRLSHASMLDAGLLSGARLKRYSHNDVDDLERKLADRKSSETLIATDGVFSMDGDLAPLERIVAIARKEQAWLMVDDAHGLGVLGKNGRGTLEHFKLGLEDVPILMGTLGKAFGCSGAFVAGSEDLIETLINQSRSYIYTTASPPAVAEACRTSLKLVREESWRRERLRSLIDQFRQGAQQLGLELMSSSTPIQPVCLGDSARAVQCSELLWQAGIYIPAIRPPTVPAGSARLRISFNADHETGHVDQLLDALEKTL